MAALHAPEYGIGSGAPSGALAGHEVVVGFDGSAAALAAVRWAAAEAAQLESPLMVVYAADVPVSGGWGAGGWRSGAMPSAPDLVRLSRSVAARGAAAAREHQPGLLVHSLGVVGGAAAELVAHSADAGLVVVGHRRRGVVQAAVLGSVSFAVAMHARCPVVVVNDAGQREPHTGARPVVVGVDGSRAAQAALHVAAQLALASASPLRLVSAWQIPVREPWSDLYGGLPALMDVQSATAAVVKDDVDLAVTALRAQHPTLQVSGQAVEGRAAEVLVDASTQAGLVVVGSRGHGGFAGMMLGSVSHAVLRAADSPVVVVRRGAF
jgi:nucleotide-binding universal stress UspA family protein